MRLVVCILMGTAIASAYVRLNDGALLEHRADNTNIQFFLNSSVAAGLKNAEGQTWIASDSDIAGAVSGAIRAWNSVGSANVHFADIQPTTLLDGTSNQNVIAFDDTVENRELTNGASAVTVRILAVPDRTGAFIKTDIIFNPTVQFSTNRTAGTFDLQSVLTHELGHSLGADHSGVLSATMFQASAPGSNNQAHLSQDDIAFVTAAYPRSNAYGTIAGSATDQNGNALRGALVTAQDPATGAIVGGFSDPGDGSFSFLLPAGSYQIWAEPLTGIVQARNLYLTSAQEVSTAFQPVLSSELVKVADGVTSTVSLQCTAGASPVAIQFSGAVPPHTAKFNIYAGPAAIPSGTNAQIVIQATGLGSDFSDGDITMVGPATLVPGSVVPLGNSQFELTLNVPAVSQSTSASLVINYHGSTASFSGGLLIEPATPSFPANGIGNVFSYAAEAVAPGEIVAIFGTNLGPVAGAVGAFDTNGILATDVGGVEVRFNGQPAPIYFASAGQINVEVPYEVEGSASATIVISAGGAASAAVSIPVQASMPGLLASAINSDGSVNSEDNPVSRGGYVILYAVGLGAKTAEVLTGKRVAGAEASAAPVTVSLNAQPYIPEYAGSAPGFTGLDQINVAIPSTMTPGKGTVLIEVNGQTSQTIPIWVR